MSYNLNPRNLKQDVCAYCQEDVVYQSGEVYEKELCDTCYDNNNIYFSMVKVNDDPEHAETVWVDITDDANVRTKLEDKHGTLNIKIIPVCTELPKDSVEYHDAMNYISRQ